LRPGGHLSVVADGGDIGGHVGYGERRIAGLHGSDDATPQILEDDGAVDPDQVAAATAVDAVAPSQIGDGGRRLGHPAGGIGTPEEITAVGPASGGTGDETVGADSRDQLGDGMHVVDGAVGIQILADDDLLQVAAGGGLDEQLQELGR